MQSHMTTKSWFKFYLLCLSYAEKPVENSEDPQDVKAISDASENVGDLKLKSAKDFIAPKHLRMNAEKKRAELATLEEKVNNFLWIHLW